MIWNCRIDNGVDSSFNVRSHGRRSYIYMDIARGRDTRKRSESIRRSGELRFLRNHFDRAREGSSLNGGVWIGWDGGARRHNKLLALVNTYPYKGEGISGNDNG